MGSGQSADLRTKFAGRKVDDAGTKAHWMKEWDKLCQQRRDGSVTQEQLAERIITQAKQVEGDDFPISLRSLHLWKKAYYAKGADGAIVGLEGLVDRRGVGIADVADRDGRDPAAVECFYRWYHTTNQLAVKKCHEMVLNRARQEGWSWPKSYTATAKWLRENDDLGLSMLARDGKDLWARRYNPHIEVDYSLIEPGDLFVCDHTQCDF